MDIVTHALCGALAGQTLIRKSSVENRHARDRFLPLKTAGAGAVFPDLDFILFPANPLVFLADWHQSFTHSLVLAPAWAALLTVLCVSFSTSLRHQRRLIYCAFLLGIVSHILLDVLTVYGTRLLYPLSSRDFSLGTTFLIDPVIILIMAVGLFLSLQKRATRMATILTMAALGLYIAFQWHLKIQAAKPGGTFIPQASGGSVSTVALPQPFSPFHWLVIVTMQDHYSAALVDLAGQSQKLAPLNGIVPYIHLVSAYRSPSEAVWKRHSLRGDAELQSLIEEAWHQQALDKFRDFAVFPALYRVDRDARTTCVWFTEVRYHISVMLPPFRYGMCREGEEGDWKLYRLRYFTVNTRQALE
jgi:inner membrane protein